MASEIGDAYVGVVLSSVKWNIVAILNARDFVLLCNRLTLLVLVIESNWTNARRKNSLRVAGRNFSGPDACWLSEEFEVVEACHPCTDFEIASKISKVCADTHFKEAVSCKRTGLIYRSCERVAWIDEKKFWQFQGIVFVVGSVSASSVILRKRVLDHRTLRRVQRQLANSV